MEDALAQLKTFLKKNKNNSLNPCFNGRCTRTGFMVSLGVITHDSLNPCFNGRCTRTRR